MTDLWSCRRTTSRQTSRFSDAPELQSFGEKCGYAEKVPSFFKECLTENLIAKRQSSLTRAISIPPYSGAQDHHEGKFSMPTFTLSGFQISRDTNDDVVAINAVSLALVTPADQTTFSYIIETPATSEDLPIVDIDAATASVRVSGAGIPGGDASLPNDDITSLGTITTSTGSHDVLSIEVRDEDGSSEELIFLIGGDPLALPTTVGGFEALEATITGLSAASGALAPGAVIDFGTLSDVAVAPDPASVIVGSDDNDDLVGTAGDDYIGTGNATPNGDTVTGSTGNDTIDMAGNDGENGFISLDYRNMAGPLTVDIDGAADTGSVVKGADGTDTLVGVAQPLAAGWTNGGLAIVGTAAGDTFNLAPGDEQWMSVRGGDGIDSYNINGSGLVRMDFRDATQGIDVNLATGAIADDGFGNAETISGATPVFEIYGSDGDDTVVMSDAGDSYRYFGGANTNTGGTDFERVRYDVGQVQRIEADLSAGQVNVIADGGTFTDTVSSIENLRGSGGGDLMIADGSGVRLEGRAGDDTLVGGLGNDSAVLGSGSNTYVYRGGFDQVSDFDPLTDTLFIDLPGLTQKDVDDAFAAPIPFTDPFGDFFFLVDFGSPSGNLALRGLSEAQIQAIPAQLGDAGVSQIGNTIGTDGDDELFGTPGDDLITTGDATPNGDFVVGSAGDDTIDMSGMNQSSAFMTMSYQDLGSSITVDIDGAANTATVDKGALGFDTLVDIENPLIAGFDLGGLGVIGTAQADTFNLAPGTDQWMQVRGGDGVDTFNIGGDGFVRLDFASTGATVGAQVNLATGAIANDGFGNGETVTPGAVWEVRGTDLTDDITGSASNESFILRGGDDTLDGGGGFARLRYDRSGVGPIIADLGAGTVTGTWDGNGFTHSVSGIAHLRGSNNDDSLAGDTNDNQLEGRGGTDTFIHVGGDDTISDFDAGSETLIVRVAVLDQTQVDAAIDGASDTADGALVSFGAGSVLFSGRTAADLAGADVQFVDPGSVNLVPGTDNDDFLEGTPGDDLITTGDATPNGDVVVGSAGDDTIDMTGMNPNTAFMGLRYGDLGSGIDVTINGATNTGTVDKGALGTDTLLGVENPMFAGWTVGGLGLDGTGFDDTFNVTLDDLQWMSIRPGDGVDTFDINASVGQRLDPNDDVGALRLDMRFGDGIDVNLATGEIADDGYGNAEQINGNAPIWEVWGSGGDDTFVGSDNAESYRYSGGNNDLEGGLGFDRLRYDSFGVTSVTIDVSAGTATGTLNGGGTFTDTSSGFERLRGSGGNDQITGEAAVDNRYEGQGGTDTFTHLGGNDTISDFDAANETLIVRVAGLDQATVDTAIANATDTPGGAQVSFGFGTVLFSGVAAADLAGADVQFSAPGGANLVPGTDGNDNLNGTNGDDLITTGDNAGGDTGFDFVAGSFGDDTIDMSGITDGYVGIGYGGFDRIDVVIDGGANTGTIAKVVGGAAAGTDTLVEVDNPLFSGWTIGGLSIRGTGGDDTFDVTPEGEQWMSLRGGAGIDSFSINGTGLVRIDFRDATQGIDIDLGNAIGQIVNDGFGNTETIAGTRSVWDIQGSGFDDTVTGSIADESYTAFGGNNTLDGGGGFDRVRYDRDTIASVTIDAAAGTATGTLSAGGTFSDTIAGFEHLRGSEGNDQIIGEALVDNLYEGQQGTDTFVHLGGDDTIADFDPLTETLIVRVAGLDQAAVDAAVANAANVPASSIVSPNIFTEIQGGALVDFGGGNAVTFVNLTAANLAAADVQFVDPDAAKDRKST